MLQTTTRENGTRRVSHVPVGESKTEQSHRQTVNINTIVAKARKGIPPRIQKGDGLYGDFSGFTDFHTTMNRINDAKADFLCLPATTRERFANDVGRLLEFISDPANENEARELGLLPDKPAKPLEQPSGVLNGPDGLPVPASPETPPAVS